MIPPTAKPVLDERQAESAETPGARMTEVQAAELRRLCDELGEEYDASLSEAQAHDRIETLRARAEDR